MRFTVLLFLIVFSYGFNVYSSNQDDQVSTTFFKDIKKKDPLILLKKPTSDNELIIQFEKPLYSCRNEKGLNTFSGEVFMGPNYLPKGNIYLIENVKGNYETSNTAEILDGIFQFKNLKSGTYMLYVVPQCEYDFFYFPKYIPTYYGNSYNWQGSLNKDIETDLIDFTISLTSYPEPFYGQEIISGRIKYSNMFDRERIIPVPVILLNQDKVPMDFRISDNETGTFSFENLPVGIYYLHPEIPGIKSEDFLIKVVSSGNSSHNVNFLIDNNNIIAQNLNKPIIENEIEGSFLQLYLDPNYSYPVVCELVNMSGCLIKNEVFGSNVINLNINGISAGIYILRIKTYDNSLVKTQKIYINSYF